jgi:hypothetical protein
MAFYNALETNDNAVRVLGDETLRDVSSYHSPQWEMILPITTCRFYPEIGKVRKRLGAHLQLAGSESKLTLAGVAVPSAPLVERGPDRKVGILSR